MGDLLPYSMCLNSRIQKIRTPFCLLTSTPHGKELLLEYQCSGTLAHLFVSQIHLPGIEIPYVYSEALTVLENFLVKMHIITVVVEGV